MVMAVTMMMAVTVETDTDLDWADLDSGFDFESTATAIVDMAAAVSASATSICRTVCNRGSAAAPVAVLDVRNTSLHREIFGRNSSLHRQVALTTYGDSGAYVRIIVTRGRKAASP